MSTSTPSSSYIDTRPYWQGLKEQRLVIQQCLDTGRFQHYPRPASVYTGSRNLAWKEVSGHGQLVSWTSVDPKGSPFLPALVDLVEGVRLLALLATPQGQDLRTGLPLQLFWPQDSNSPAAPVFTPVSA